MNHVGGNRSSAGKLKLILSFFVCGVIGVVAAFQLLGTGDATQDQTFKLREVSVFDGDREHFLRGQICRCQDKPFTEVKNYPAFASQAPIFGAARFGARANQTNASALFYFAVDESRGTGKGYDRLYFDGNQDLDLRNDPVAKLQPNPPDHGYAPRFGGIKSKAAFDFLKVNLASNDGSPNLVELMPRLLVTGSDKQNYYYMFLYAPACLKAKSKLLARGSRPNLGMIIPFTLALIIPAPPWC